MKKWMLCVLALTMVGLTFDTAEAGGGRRGRSGGSCAGGDCGGYWGGGSAPGGWTGQYANAPMNGSGYASAYQGETVSPALLYPAMVPQTAQAPVTQASYSVPSGVSVGNGAPVYTGEAYYAPPGYAPSYGPVYGSSFGGGFGGSCRGGR